VRSLGSRRIRCGAVRLEQRLGCLAAGLAGACGLARVGVGGQLQECVAGLGDGVGPDEIVTECGERADLCETLACPVGLGPRAELVEGDLGVVADVEEAHGAVEEEAEDEGGGLGVGEGVVVSAQGWGGGAGGRLLACASGSGGGGRLLACASGAGGGGRLLACASGSERSDAVVHGLSPLLWVYFRGSARRDKGNVGQVHDFARRGG